MNWMGGARYRVQQQQRQNNNRPIYRFYSNRGGGAGAGGGVGANANRGGGWRGGGGRGVAGGGGRGNNPTYRRNANGQIGLARPQQQQPTPGGADIRRANNAASRNYVQRLEDRRPCPLLAFAKECLPRFGEAFALQLSHELELDKVRSGYGGRGGAPGPGAQRINSDESLSSGSPIRTFHDNELPDPPRARQRRPLDRDQSVPSLSPTSISSYSGHSEIRQRQVGPGRSNYFNSTSSKANSNSSSQATHISNAPSSTPIRENRPAFGQIGAGTSSCVSSFQAPFRGGTPSTPPSTSRSLNPVFSQLQRRLASSPTTVLSPSSVYSAMSMEGVQNIPPSPPSSYQKSLRQDQDQDDEVSHITSATCAREAQANEGDGDFDSDDDRALSEIPVGFSPGRSVSVIDIDLEADDDIVELQLPDSPMELEERMRNFPFRSQREAEAEAPGHSSQSASTISSQAHSRPCTPTGSIAPASYFDSICETPRPRDRRELFRKKKMVQRSLFSYFQACGTDETEAEADNANFKEPDPPVAVRKTPAPQIRGHPPIFSPCNSEVSLASATSLSQILAEPPRGAHTNPAQPFSKEFVDAQTGLREIRIATPAWLATPFLDSASTADGDGDDVYSEFNSVGDLSFGVDFEDALLLDLTDDQSLLWSGRETEPPELPSSPVDVDDDSANAPPWPPSHPEPDIMEFQREEEARLPPPPDQDNDPPLIDLDEFDFDGDIIEIEKLIQAQSHFDPGEGAGEDGEEDEVQIIDEIPPPSRSQSHSSQKNRFSQVQQDRAELEAEPAEANCSDANEGQELDAKERLESPRLETFAPLPSFEDFECNLAPTSPTATRSPSSSPTPTNEAKFSQGQDQGRGHNDQEPQYRFGLSQTAFDNDPSSPSPPAQSPALAVRISERENEPLFMDVNVNRNPFDNGNGTSDQNENPFLNFGFGPPEQNRTSNRATALSQQMELYFPNSLSPGSKSITNSPGRVWSFSQPLFPASYQQNARIFDVFAPAPAVNAFGSTDEGGDREGEDNNRGQGQEYMDFE